MKSGFSFFVFFIGVISPIYVNFMASNRAPELIYLDDSVEDMIGDKSMINRTLGASRR